MNSKYISNQYRDNESPFWYINTDTRVCIWCYIDDELMTTQHGYLKSSNDKMVWRPVVI